jgi:hypothetical protein
MDALDGQKPFRKRTLRRIERQGTVVGSWLSCCLSGCISSPEVRQDLSESYVVVVAFLVIFFAP